MNITIAQLKVLLNKNGKNLVLLDVRPSMSYENGHIPGAISMPMEQIDFRLNELDQDTIYYIICSVGVRTNQVVEKLTLYGYKAIGVLGGMLKWDGKVIKNGTE